jgi:hypothetical protein
MKKKIWANLQRIIELFTQKIAMSSQNYGFGIRNPEKPIPDPGSWGSKRHRIPDPQHCLKAADLADVGLELGVNGLDVLLEALAVRECPLAEVAQLGARPLGQLHRLFPQVHHRVIFQLTQLVKA